MAVPKRFWGYALLALAALIIGFGGRQARAQTSDARYFPETGHWVTGDFLVKYQSATDPALIYGAPITESFTDPFSGRSIQYFEKARFELHPELSGNLRVKLTKIGFYLYTSGQTLSVSTNTQACKSFVETDFVVCYAFLDFFEAHGGVSQFGYPISGFEIHDGRIVQYFDNARLEWHPENPAGERVTVSNLGYRYFYQVGENPTLLNPVPNDEAPNLPVTSLGVHAFAKLPVMSLNGTQTLYIIVQDQYHKPVEGVTVEFTVTFPDGAQKTYQADRTNALGVSVLSFDIHASRPGRAIVTVRATYNQQVTATTRTSFSLWW